MENCKGSKETMFMSNNSVVAPYAMDQIKKNVVFWITWLFDTVEA